MSISQQDPLLRFVHTGRVSVSAAWTERLRQSLTSAQWPCSLPILLTLARVALIPVFVLVFVLQLDDYWPVSALVLAIASITDWLDGAIARFTCTTSKLGEFLDPVADKLLVVTALVLLSHRTATLWVVVPSIVIVLREIAVSALREWTARCAAHQATRVSWLGKVKTTFQMIALVILLMAPLPGGITWWCGIIGLWVAALCATLSFLDYWRAAWPTLSEPRATVTGS